MRTVFEEEEEEDAAPPDSQEDRELTISSTTLLAIFFGLVLVCGLFFGLGYTLGRRGPWETSQLPSEAIPGASSGTLRPSGSQAKPSAAAQPPVAPTPTSDAETADTSDGATPSLSPEDGQAETRPSESTANPAPQPVKLQTTPPASAQSTASPAQSPAITPAPGAATAIMVQIAAISNAADANVLVGALQKRGYSVTTRRVPGDPLIHVQVGPFSSRADAVAMRQKLLNDGYNAILK
jgi:cell division septation protein DedD